MNWDAVGAIGEIIGAVAVVATLAFLAVQIRQSQRTLRDANVIARYAAADKAFEQFSEFYRLVGADPEVTRIWIAGCAEEKLEGIDAERFYYLAITYLSNYGISAERASVFHPGMETIYATWIQEELDLHPGLKPIWNQVLTRFEAGRSLRDG